MTALLLAFAQLLWGVTFVGAVLLVGLALRAAVTAVARDSRPVEPRRPFIPEQRS